MKITKYIPHTFFALFFIIFIINIINGNLVSDKSSAFISQVSATRWYSTDKADSIRDVALKSKLLECMQNFGVSISEADDSKFGDFFSVKINKDRILNRYNQAEADCSKPILQTVSFNNENQAKALAYYLISKGVSIPDEYKKFAKQDNLALASIQY